MLAVTALVLLFESTFGEVLQTGSLVHPMLLEERGLRGERYLRINEDLTLKLEKSNILARNFVLVDSQGGNTETRMVNGTKLEENLYHSMEHMSSLLVKEKENGVEVEGILKHNLRIRPLPISERSPDGLIAHEVHEINLKKVQDEGLQMIPAEARNSDFQNHSAVGSNRTRISEKGTYVYEILVLLDKKYVCHFSRNPDDLVGYVITYMNSVQQFFSGMRRPKIRLAVVGIVKMVKDDFLRFTDEGIDGAASLEAFKIKSDEYVTTSTHDVVLIFTAWNVLRGGRSTYAFPAKLCTDLGLSIVGDIPQGFDSMRKAAQALCYVIGAEFDGYPPLVIVWGHPGAQSCSPNDHYLMGNGDYDSPNTYKMSNCTEVQIRYMLSKTWRGCKRRASAIDLLEGWNKSRGFGLSKQARCDSFHPREDRVVYQEVSGSDYNAEKCLVACCFIAQDISQYVCSRHPLLEGQICVGNKTCRNGVCGDHIWN